MRGETSGLRDDSSILCASRVAAASLAFVLLPFPTFNDVLIYACLFHLILFT